MTKHYFHNYINHYKRQSQFYWDESRIRVAFRGSDPDKVFSRGSGSGSTSASATALAIRLRNTEKILVKNRSHLFMQMQRATQEHGLLFTV